jgi:hypothetical protein
MGMCGKVVKAERKSACKSYTGLLRYKQKRVKRYTDIKQQVYRDKAAGIREHESKKGCKYKSARLGK